MRHSHVHSHLTTQLLLEVEDHPDDTATGLSCFSALLRYKHNDPTIVRSTIPTIVFTALGHS